MKYDLLLKNGCIVDYATDSEKYSDIALKDGKIVRIANDIESSDAQELFDLKGATVMPGIIDSHMHVSEWVGGSSGHKMMAKAGVTSALDMAGPGDSVFRIMKDFGVGLNIATIEYIRPGHTVNTQNPEEAEINSLLDKVLKNGSIGLKLLGGHYPLTPEATARSIKLTAKRNAHIAFHVGTTTRGSNIEGFLEAVELAEGSPLHVAHINDYCRGLIKPYMEETEIAVKTLTDNPHIISEAYLSPLNGTSAEIVNGAPGSKVTQSCLVTGGYDPTEAGMEKAILDGWAQVNYPYAGETILVRGKDAAAYWRANNTNVGVSFSVNPVEPRIRLASAKRPDGSFVVDCISTDGGGIPRNVIIPMGLALIDMGALTWKEFVKKTSYNPAKMLGLVNKGCLEEGKDADITVIDAAKREAIMTVVNGKVCMYMGYVTGKGGRVITTDAGAENVKAMGFEPVVVNLENRKIR